MTRNIRNEVISVNSSMKDLLVMSDRQDLHFEKNYLNPDFHEYLGIVLVFSKRLFDNCIGYYI